MAKSRREVFFWRSFRAVCHRHWSQHDLSPCCERQSVFKYLKFLPLQYLPLMWSDAYIFEECFLKCLHAYLNYMRSTSWHISEIFMLSMISGEFPPPILSIKDRHHTSHCFSFSADSHYLHTLIAFSFCAMQTKLQKSTHLEYSISCLMEEEMKTSGHKGSCSVWVSVGLCLSLGIGWQQQKSPQTQQFDVDLMFLIQNERVILWYKIPKTFSRTQLSQQPHLRLPCANKFVLLCWRLTSAHHFHEADHVTSLSLRMLCRT